VADAKTISLGEQVRAALVAEKIDSNQVVQRLDSLLEYLCSPAGRTDSNCRFVDSFFMKHDEWAELGLPDALHDIFADLAGALHDTVSAPEVAQNFESTPQQLRERLRAVRIEPTAGVG